MTIDLDAVARAAAEQVAAKLLEQLPAIVRAELERRDRDGVLDAAALARYLGKSTAALGMWLRPGRGGAELAALAVDVGGRRAWRRSDLEGWLSRKGSR
jgi:hypothetical protein